MTERTASHEHQVLRLTLLERATDTLWLARIPLTMGYLPQALLLARSALEDWATAEYVRRHPDKAPRYLEAPEPPTGRGATPRFGDIFADLRAEHGRYPYALYEFLSYFAHPRAPSLHLLINLDDTLRVRLGRSQEWDARGFAIGLMCLLQVTSLFFALMHALWEELAGSTDLSWSREGTSLSREIGDRVKHAAVTLRSDDPERPEVGD